MSHHPEDALDVLLSERAWERRRAGEEPEAAPPWERTLDTHDVVEIEPLLAAAARIDTLRDAAPSAAFVDDLEQRLMARMLQSGQPAQPAQPQAPARHQAHPNAFFTHISTRIPARVAWTGVAAALALTIGVGVFSAQAAPGQPLYPVRQFAQHVAPGAFPSPTAATPGALDRARADLAAYNAEIAQGNATAALATLRALRADDARAAADAAALSDATARSAAQAQVAQFRQGAQVNLLASLATLAWQGRAQVTDVLRSWGATALVVTQARALGDTSSAQSSHANNSAASALLVITGKGFTSATVALVNGRLVGVIVSLSPTELTVRLPASDLAVSPLVVGVEAGDGTVALAPALQREDGGAPSHEATPGKGNPGNGHSAATGEQSTPTSEAGATQFS